MDILLKKEDWIFSYRVAGICVRDGKVLLQTPRDRREYAFPGGHAAFGETSTETLTREFREEMGAEIAVGELKWVWENFFRWGERECHQLCLYHMVEILNCADDVLAARENHLEFHWVPIAELGGLEVYPPQAQSLLQRLDEGVQHFCRE